jgi:hypothetical protein
MRPLTPTLLLLLTTLFAVACAPRQEEAAQSRADGDASATGAAAKTETAAASKSAQTPAARAQLPPSTGKLTPADRKAWREIVGWPEDCEEAFQATAGSGGENAGLEFFDLGEGRRLVQVLCAGGAYQPSQVFAVVDESGAKPSAKVLTFDIYESPSDDKLEKTSAQELWGLADFDARTKQLKVHNRFRGPGDCGTLATYGFDGGTPRLKELRADTRCDGKGADNPEQWKKVSGEQ